jgi:flagellar protein FliL
MKKPFVLMISIIGGIAVLIALVIGGFLYLKSATGPKTHKPPSPSALKNLRVDLPQNTSNLASGLIQYTVSLQAADTKTKTEITDMLPVVQDAIITTLKKYSSSDVNSSTGFAKLHVDLVNAVNQVLPDGKVTDVYFSTDVVQ